MSKVAKWIFPAAGGKDGIIGTAKAVVGFLTGNAGLVMDGVRQVAGAGRKGDAQARQASVLNLQLGEVPRQAVIGIACTAGSLVDVFSFGGQYGTDKVTRCVALADHAIDGIEGFYINEVYYPWVGEGLQAAFGNKLSFHFRQATADGHEPPAHVMANGGWPAAHRLVGLTVMWIDWYVDDKIWPQGHPAIRFVLRGLRVYDPRFDPLYGYAGPNPQTWADRSSHLFSRNAKVLRYAYARGIYVEGRQGQPEHLLIGRGLSEEESPGDLVIPDANLCDEIVDGVARYTANGVISASQPFIEVDGMFAAAMAGVIVQREGTVDVEAGQAKAVVATFTDADLIPGEKVGFSRFLGDNDGGRLNTFIGRYIEPLLGFKDHSAPVRRSQADILADGGPRESTVSLSLVTEVKQADRIVEINRLLSRLERRGNVVLPPRFAGLEEGDWVAWQSARRHKGATVRYRIEAYREPETWRKYLTLREIASSVFGVPDPVEDFTAPPPPPVVIDALALAGVTAEAITLPGDTSTVPAIRFRWTAPVDAAVLAIRAEVRRVGETDAAPTRTEEVNAGVVIATNGVGPDQGLECRLVPIGDPSRPVLASNWITVSTSGLVAGDVSPDAPGLSQIQSDIKAAFGDILDVSGLISQTRADLNAVDAALLGAIEDTNASLGAATEGLLAADAALLGAIEDTNASLGAASASLMAADEALSLAIGSVGDRAQVLEETTAGLEANKASVGALNAQVARIDGVEGVNATQALALVDLENGKVAVSEYDTLKGEVAAARDGSPSLLGQIQSLKAVDLDLQANKASVSVVEDLAARTASAEAGLTTLDEAIVAEAVARSESISLQSARVDGVEAVNATQALALVDLENNKVALNEYNTLKGEVAAARDGAPSLLGQIQNLKSVDLDIQNNKASVASVDALTARAAAAEADIIDLENAVATEAGARAEAISQVAARQAINQNLMPNGSGENGPVNWSGPGLQALNVPALGGTLIKFALAGSYVEKYASSPRAKVSGGQTVTLQWKGVVEGAFTGSLQIYIAFLKADGSYAGEGARKVVTDPNPVLTSTAPGDAAFAILSLFINGNAGAGVNILLSRCKIEAGSVATIYSNDATAAAISASVTEQALALIDLESGKVALSEYNTLKGEVAAARDGAASLLGQIQNLKSVDLDIQNNKASVASVDALTARAAAAEADIIDLENAVATEAGARAEAISQVAARQAINQNLMPNGSGENGPVNWSGPGLQALNVPALGGTLIKFALAGSYVEKYASSPRAKVSGGQTVTLQWKGVVEGAFTGSLQIYIAFLKADGSHAGEGARKVVTDPNPVLTSTAPGDAAFAILSLFINGNAGAGVNILLSRCKIEAGSVATIYSNDATAAAISAAVTEQALALIDLESGKVALSEYNTLKGEVAAARDGAASLLGQIQNLKSVDLDIQNNKASVASVDALTARAAAAEADIIDLENAVATEAGARAEAISQVAARQAINQNLMPNGSGENGPVNWSGPGLQALNVPALGGTLIKFALAGSYVEKYASSPRAKVSGGQTVTLQWKGVVEGAFTGSLQIYIAFLKADGSHAGEGARKVVTDPNPVLTSTAPGDAAFAILSLFINGNAGAGVNILLSRCKIEAGSVATIYSNDATAAAISAAVTEQALALIDLENNQALASFRKIAEASGGAPAYYEFVSSSSGGYAAIAAPVVALVNTAPGGGVPLVALEAVNGEVRVARRLYVGSGAGQFLIDAPNQIQTIRDAAGNLRLELGLLP